MSNGNCCDGLKEQLSALNAEVGRVKSEFQKANQQINNLNNRINNLDAELKKLKQGGDKNNNDSEIFKRLAKSERDILDLGGIIKDVIDDIKNILDSVDEHNQNANESQSVLSNILNFFIDE